MVTVATMSGPGIAPAAKSMVAVLGEVSRRYADASLT